MNLNYKTMVKSYNETDTIKVFEEVGNGCYQIKWAVTPIKEKVLDEDGNDTGEKKETSLSSYVLERYNYKPSMELVLGDILASDDKASMEEIKTICEGFGVEPLAYLKKAMLRYIEDYDTSTAVNSFVLNGAEVWLDKATRVGLMNSTTIAKAAGQETTTLWLGETKLEVECDKAIQLLGALEMYALECFNVTASHKKAVSDMDSVDDVVAYDYTVGYPEKLTMTV